MNKLVENHHVVAALWSAVNTSSGSLENVAPLVKKLLKTGAWKKREVPQLGRIIEFEHFGEFIQTNPLEGCGWPPEKVEALIKDDPETLTLWRRAMVGKPGAHSTNVTMKALRGNTRAYTLDRLEREQPDLFKQVKAGKISANAAAKKAGIRKPPSPLTELRKWWKKASLEQRAAFLAEVSARRAA